MQPQTTVKFDRKTFDRIKKTIKNISTASRVRKEYPNYAALVPEEIGIQLTYRCNMRCNHCFQWNERGFFHNFEKKEKNRELDANIIEKILKETEEAKSNLYFWGGEPLVHREWEEIVKILEKDSRWTVLCTNGLLLEKKLESLLRISSNLALLISLDGFQEENDAIRGKGTFHYIEKNLMLLSSIQKKGEYKGKISLNCVLNDQIVPKLFEFTEYCESLAIDTIYFCFPWFISEKTAILMDEYYQTNFSWLNSLMEKQKSSWHSYTYHLAHSTIDILQKQIKKLNSRAWKIRFRFQPALEIEEFEDFIKGKEKPGQNKCQCLAVSNRMDVLANGDVSACKLFPEFTIGNLYEQRITEIWHSERFNKVREIIHKGLMPICSKCVLLYLHGR